MALRMLEYLVHIYKGQVRAATRGGRPRADFRLQPVMPVVLYTGERSWEALTSLGELIEGGGADFADVVPQFRPLFLNLAAVPAEELETSGGYFGWLLELIRLRHAPADEFRATTTRVVCHLEAMAEVERERWLLFLSYIGTMIHQERARPEHPGLYELIGNSIRSDTRRREVETIMETMADYLRAEGRRAGEIHSRQQTLVRLLRRRFGRVPRDRTTDPRHPGHHPARRLAGQLRHCPDPRRRRHRGAARGGEGDSLKSALEERSPGNPHLPRAPPGIKELRPLFLTLA